MFIFFSSAICNGHLKSTMQYKTYFKNLLKIISYRATGNGSNFYLVALKIIFQEIIKLQISFRIQ